MRGEWIEHSKPLRPGTSTQSVFQFRTPAKAYFLQKLGLCIYQKNGWIIFKKQSFHIAVEFHDAGVVRAFDAVLFTEFD